MVIFDGFSQQLPDIDPQETAEWVDSLEMVADERGRTPRPVPPDEASCSGPASSASACRTTVSSPYINTIPPEREPWFPGDEHIERRIRAFIRWNAAVMVTPGQQEGQGGSAATWPRTPAPPPCTRWGSTTFLPGQGQRPGRRPSLLSRAHARPGDLRPGRSSRGRLTESQLDPLPARRSPAARAGGLSSYPHPPAHAGLLGVPHGVHGDRPDQRRLPGPLSNRYLLNRELSDTSKSRGVVLSWATGSSTSPRAWPG